MSSSNDAAPEASGLVEDSARSAPRAPWAKLPSELKIMIFQYVFPRFITVYYKFHKIIAVRRLNPIVTTSKDFYSLGMDTYTELLHCISINTRPNGHPKDIAGADLNIFRYPKPPIANRLTSLQITLAQGLRDEDMSYMLRMEDDGNMRLRIEFPSSMIRFTARSS